MLDDMRDTDAYSKTCLTSSRDLHRFASPCRFCLAIGQGTDSAAENEKVHERSTEPGEFVKLLVATRSGLLALYWLAQRAVIWDHNATAS